MKKILIGTLYSGENEYQECIDSVDCQLNAEVTHKRIEWLPKKEAHQKLFELFENNKKNYDYFVKLDADMKFSTPLSLHYLISKFTPDTDIISFSVRDFFTDGPMQSLNIFSNRCGFNFACNDELFTDNLPIEYDGKRKYLIDEPNPNIYHAFNPSEFQSFIFGIHRSLKIVQNKSKKFRVANAYHQQKILNSTYVNYKRENDSRLYYAILGAHLVLSGEISDSVLKSKNDYEDVFKKYKNTHVKDKILKTYFKSTPIISILKSVGFKKTTVGFLRYIIRKLIQISESKGVFQVRS